MARPPARFKRGYYPCPPRIIDMIASHLQAPTGRALLLDPCAGEGKAIMQIRDLLGAENTTTYGIEIAPERADICRDLPFDRFLKADATAGVDYPRQFTSLLWFNPPYDFDTEDKKDGREELRFFNHIVKIRRTLKPGGLFIGILKWNIIPLMADPMLKLLDGPQENSFPELLVFPDPEFDEFGQVVVLGRMRKRARPIIPETELKAWLDSVMDDNHTPLGFASEETHKWAIPGYQKGETIPDMLGYFFDPVEGAKMAREHGWMTRPAATDTLFGRHITQVETLCALNASHTAGAVAAGFFNGEVIDSRAEGGRIELVKGSTVKRVVPGKVEAEPNGVFKRVDMEQFTSEVNTVDIDGTWRLYQLPTKISDEKQEKTQQGDIQTNNLIEWVSLVQDALQRESKRLFPPLISDKDLEKYDLSAITTPTPRLRQNELIKIVKHQIDHKEPIFLIVQMGGGKTFVTAAALRSYIEEARAKGKKFRTIVICDKHMLMKWKRELERVIPDVKVSIVEKLADIDPYQPRIRGAKPEKKGRMTEKTYRKMMRQWENPHPLDAEVFCMAYTDISLGANRIPAAVNKFLTTKGYNGQVKFEWMDTPDPQTGKKVPYRVLTCPDCGHVQMVYSKGRDIHMTVQQMEANWQFCQKPKSRLVLDEKHGTEIRKSESFDPETGQTTLVRHAYHREILKNKRGETIRCGAALWQQTADTPKDMSVPGEVFLKSPNTLKHPPKDSGKEATYITNLSSLEETQRYRFKSYKLMDVKGAHEVHVGGPRKMELSTFLAKHFKEPCTDVKHPNGKKLSIKVTVVDEMHKTKAKEAARGIAASNIAGLAELSMIGLTGTLTGGYASTMFYLLWRYTPLIRQFYKYKELSRFIHRYGQYSYTFKSKEAANLVVSETTGRRSRKKSDERGSPKEIPGLSPEAYLLFWKYTVFAKLIEIFPHLDGKYSDQVMMVDMDNEIPTTWKVPVYDEHDNIKRNPETNEPIYVEAIFTQKSAYEYIRNRLEIEAKRLLGRGDKGLLSAMLQTLLSQPNSPGDEIKIIHPRSKQVVVQFPGLRTDVVYPKEEAVLKQIVEDARAGHKSLVFVSHTGKHDVLARMAWVLDQAQRICGHKLNVATLRSTDVDAIDREEWLNEQVEGDENRPPIDVLIINPKCIETGLDLVAFSRIHFVEEDYSIYTTAQAARRTLRPGQEKSVITYYWVYNKAMETVAAKLVAMKAKELSKVSGSDLNEALIQQAGDFNLHELLVASLTDKFSAENMSASEEDIQSEFDAARSQEAANREKLKVVIEDITEAVMQQMPLALPAPVDPDNWDNLTIDEVMERIQDIAAALDEEFAEFWSRTSETDDGTLESGKAA